MHFCAKFTCIAHSWKFEDIYNFPKKQFDSVMDKDAEQEEEFELQEEDESDIEFVEDLGDDEEWENDLDNKVEEVELDSGFGMADLEDMSGPSKKKRRKGPRLEVEYEQEMDAR